MREKQVLKQNPVRFIAFDTGMFQTFPRHVTKYVELQPQGMTPRLRITAGSRKVYLVRRDERHCLLGEVVNEVVTGAKALKLGTLQAINKFPLRLVPSPVGNRDRAKPSNGLPLKASETLDDLFQQSITKLDIVKDLVHMDTNVIAPAVGRIRERMGVQVAIPHCLENWLLYPCDVRAGNEPRTLVLTGIATCLHWMNRA